MTETFGEQLKGLRLAGGYSRRELAEGAGVSEGAIRDYEQGKRAPSLEAVLRLSLALGKPLSVWEHCAGLAAGAYRLPAKASRAGALEFGRYRGRLLEEVPTDYLEWLERERPRQLTPAQLETVRRLQRDRDRDRRIGEAEAREAAQAERLAASRARAGTQPLSRAEAMAARAEAERVAAEARLAEAEAQRTTAETKRLELEEARKKRQAEELRPATRPCKAAKPALDDAVPWERGEQPPGLPPES